MNSKQRRLMRRLLTEAGLLQAIQASPPSPEAESKPSWKVYAKWFYSGLTFLIAAVALVELFPRPSAAAYPPSDADHILNSRFTVSNDGYLQLVDFEAACFVWTTNNPKISEQFRR
jgi:hypothetical protein